MDPETKKALQTEVPTSEVRKVFVVIFLLFAPFILFIVVPDLKEYTIMFGGKTIIAYYLFLAVLVFRALWRDRVAYVEIERRIDEKMERRPILRPLWVASKVCETVAGLAAIALVIYLFILLFA